MNPTTRKTIIDQLFHKNYDTDTDADSDTSETFDFTHKLYTSDSDHEHLTYSSSELFPIGIYDHEEFTPCNQRFFICMYSIYTSLPIPFICFVFEKKEMFSFPLLKTNAKAYPHLLQKCSEYTKTFADAKHTGNIVINNDIFIFFNLPDNYYLENTKSFFMLTMHDIIQEKQLHGIPVDQSAITLFSNKPKLRLLYDDDENHFPIPIVGYITAPKQETNFIQTNGLLRSPHTSKYYGFFVLSTVPKKESSKSCIIRFAIFPGKYTVAPEASPKHDTTFNDKQIILSSDDQFLLLSSHD